MTTAARAAGVDDLRAKSTQGSTKAPDLSANGGAGRCLFVSAGPLYPSRAGVPGPRGRVCAEALPSGRRVGEGGGTGSCRSAGRPAAARGEGGDVPLSRACHARRVEAGRPGNGPSWSRPRVCSGVGTWGRSGRVRVATPDGRKRSAPRVGTGGGGAAREMPRIGSGRVIGSSHRSTQPARRSCHALQPVHVPHWRGKLAGPAGVRGDRRDRQGRSPL